MKLYLGENIRRLRTERGLTQDCLAEFLGVSFQAVSKWERGDTVPDLYMLPVLASFFGVTTDALLGVNQNAAEKEILSYLNVYGHLWQQARYEEVMQTMKQAVKSYPGEYRLLVRYLNALLWCNRGDPARAVAVRAEAEAIYARITNHCITDNIRIWAKTLMCRYYACLAEIDSSGITHTDVQAILAELPLMQNCRDYLAPVFAPVGDEKAAAGRKTIDELAYLFVHTVREFIAGNSAAPIAEKHAAAQATIRAVQALFYEDDYGKCTREFTLLLADAAEFADSETAEYCRKTARALAETFDRTDALSCTSALHRGLTVQKREIPMAQSGRLADVIQSMLQ